MFQYIQKLQRKNQNTHRLAIIFKYKIIHQTILQHLTVFQYIDYKGLNIQNIVTICALTKKQTGRLNACNIYIYIGHNIGPNMHQLIYICHIFIFELQ